jgi:hypothetical protein
MKQAANGLVFNLEDANNMMLRNVDGILHNHLCENLKFFIRGLHIILETA